MDATANEKTSPGIGHCRDCRWWSDPIPKQKGGTLSDVEERICLMSKKAAFGLYGQDGKAVITGPSFGCVAFIAKPPAPVGTGRRVLCRKSGCRVFLPDGVCDRGCLPMTHHVRQADDAECPLRPKSTERKP